MNTSRERPGLMGGIPRESWRSGSIRWPVIFRWHSALMAVVFPLAAGCGPRLVGPEMESWQPGRRLTSPMITNSTSQEPTKSGVEGDTVIPLRSGSSILPPDPSARRAIYHEVLAGESLSSIAARHGTSVDELAAVNGLTRDSILQPGQQLFVREIQQ